MKKEEKKKVIKTQKRTNVHFILDKSGSMMGVQDATISGFNEYLANLRKDAKSKYNLSLTLFDTKVEEKYTMKPLEEVEDLSRETYMPDGMTALYDAVCRTISKIEAGEDKHLVVIMTDGEENSSQEYTDKDLARMIKELEKGKNWTFVFLGANQDAWIVGQKMGLSKMNTATYNNTRGGIKKTMDVLASCSMSLSESESSSSAAFFSQDDQDIIKNSK